MAKGKNNRSCCAKNGNMMSCHGPPKSRSAGANNIELTQEAIDQHWDALPPTAKSFILDTPDGMFPLNKLIKYWSQPQNIQCCQGAIAGSICGATWYLALVYLKMRMWKEARALTINGAFIHQCYNSSLELIKEVCESGNVTNEDLPYFVRGFNSIRSPESMEKFIRSYLPKEYTQMMTSFANLSSSKSMRGYVDQISDDWKGTSSPSSKNGSRSNKGIDDNGAKIQLVLVDDADENERHSFDICSSTTLKSLFNDYADKRGISLRLLRFSYRGNMLFLSSAGHKTPEELNMKDQDIIEVHDTSSKNSRESSDDDSSDSQPQHTASSKKSKSKKGSKSKKSKKKSNKKSQPHVIELSMSMEEYKVEHSKNLTKIHDEAATQFKQIRQHLNNLVIERSQPKNKSKRPRSPKSSQPSLPTTVVNNPAREGLGGKAGKSHFVVQVGEVQNLYKSTKQKGTQCNASSALLDTLDLHGCTQDEALMKLNDTLKTWVDAAMQGSYPFVQQAVIVCGCGNQVLSETVQDWIKSTDKVSNAPKSKVRSSTRRQGFAIAA